MEFSVGTKVTLYCHTTVEAETEEEALEIARSRELASPQFSESMPDIEYYHYEGDSSPTTVWIEK